MTTRVEETGTLIAGTMVAILSIVSAVCADRMCFVDDSLPVVPLGLGVVAITLGSTTIVMGRSIRSKSRVILIVLGTLSILLTAPVISVCGYLALGGSR